MSDNGLEVLSEGREGSQKRVELRAVAERIGACGRRRQRTPTIHTITDCRGPQSLDLATEEPVTLVRTTLRPSNLRFDSKS